MPQVKTVTPDGDAIMARRREVGLTRAQLAAKMRRSESAVRNIENGGKSIASLVFARQIARALGVRLADIVKDEAA